MNRVFRYNASMGSRARKLWRWLLLAVTGALALWFSLTGVCAVALTALSIATTLGYAGPEPKNSNNITELFGAYSLVALVGAVGSILLFRALRRREAKRIV